MTQHPWNKTHQTTPSLRRPYAPAAQETKSCSFTSLSAVRQTVCLSARNLRAYFFWTVAVAVFEFLVKAKFDTRMGWGTQTMCRRRTNKVEMNTIRAKYCLVRASTINDFVVCVDACVGVRVRVCMFVCVLRQEPGNRNSLIGGRRMMNATEIVRRGVLQQQPPVASWGVNLNKDGFRVTSHLPHKNDPFCTTSANQV